MKNRNNLQDENQIFWENSHTPNKISSTFMF